MTHPVICKLLRAGEVREVFTVRLPADPLAARALLEWHYDSAVRGDSASATRAGLYRLAVHAQDGTHLYDVEATP